MTKKSYTNRKKLPKIFVSKSTKIDLKNLRKEIYRVDLEFFDLDHSGLSYEGRIFINNPSANHDTSTTKKNGYVGSYHIFGHGGCFGGIGHCSVKKKEMRRPYDFRPTHPLTPIYKRLEITDYLMSFKNDIIDIKITIVPIIAQGCDEWFVHTDTENIIKLKKIMLKTYR